MPHFTGFPKTTERTAPLLHMEGMSTAASTGDMGGFSTSSAGCTLCHSRYPLF
jgi:hypothetical protein